MNSVSPQHTHYAQVVAASRQFANNRTAAMVVAVVGVLLGGFALFEAFSRIFLITLLDVGVFRDAGFALANGFPLYSEEFPSRSGFRFIYPPFAAVLFVPLTWLGETAMEVLWTSATVAAVAGIIAMGLRRLGVRHFWLWLVGLTGVGVFLDPLQANMLYGQINVFLFLLVTADVLGFIPRRLRGLGIGVAAGIKITPAAFAVLFLVRRDWVGVAQSAGWFLLTALVGALVRWQDSVYFWTTEFFLSDRGGAPPYPPNQALTGLIARLGVSNELAQGIMKPGFLVVAALAVWAAWRLTLAGRDVDALLVVFVGASLASPLAVSHHWSGVVLALVVVLRPLNRWVGAALVFMLLAHAAGMYRLYEPEQPTYDFSWLWFPGNAQAIAGLVFFVVMIVSLLRLPRGEVEVPAGRS